MRGLRESLSQDMSEPPGRRRRRDDCRAGPQCRGAAADRAKAAVSAPHVLPATDGLPGTARIGGLRRRPTGTPPPLPRKLGKSGKVWLALAALLPVAILLLSPQAQPRAAMRAETAILRAVATLRSDWLTPVMRVVATLGTAWSVTILGWGLVAALIVFKRWRHLATFLVYLSILGAVGAGSYFVTKRPRPYGVTIIGDWIGFSFPSFPVAILAACLMGIAYSLVVPGRARGWTKLGIGVLLALVAFARLYLGVDHPSDVVWAVVLGVALPLAAFRWFTPNEAFPVTYRRGKTAHLDVSGARGEAIRQAVREQLGLTVLEIKPVGLEASGGSTPLRLRIAGEPDTYVFAKLYAKSHVRADRWYKLGRKILYGALEDETSFQNVRRFVQYEDYTLRLMQDMKLPVPASYGIVEITPEREYLIVMEFFDGAVEISDSEVDDGIIDEGLQLIRKLWNAGLAHRDIKPGNLMVRDGRVLLVDAFFVQVRPSPWRQAVDLGNMMLVLAVGSDPEQVYRHALRYFTPAEIAEAFAATRGVASPTQLRMAMKHDGRDLLTQFRRLAPERQPIAIQRWSVRRVALAGGVLISLLLAVGFTFSVLTPFRGVDVPDLPGCTPESTTVLLAQAVPAATSLPCVVALPTGWSSEGGVVRNGEARFSLDAARGPVVTVTLAATCDSSAARAVSSDEPGIQRFDDASQETGPRRYYRFLGGCATYEFLGSARNDPQVLALADATLGFVPRDRVATYVRDQTGLALCGAGVGCPGG
jgi:membrane-associated phospholipid phosphatase/tRNA A-37 threonylcarbamoyl transferase component Bud32